MVCQLCVSIRGNIHLFSLKNQITFKSDQQWWCVLLLCLSLGQSPCASYICVAKGPSDRPLFPPCFTFM